MPIDHFNTSFFFLAMTKAADGSSEPEIEHMSQL